MRISDWSSDVCSSDLGGSPAHRLLHGALRPRRKPRAHRLRAAVQQREGVGVATIAPPSPSPKLLTSRLTLGSRATARALTPGYRLNRTSAATGNSVDVSVVLGGSRPIQKKKNNITQ